MELHHQLVGAQGPQGRPMVFLHGLFGQGRNFARIAKALADRHPTLAAALVDLPNHGRSPWTDSIDYQDMAGAVAEFIRAWSPGVPVVLLGHSMGGRTAMQLALRWPELVERLVAVDISPVAGDSSSSVFADLISGLRKLDLATVETRGQADEALTPFIPHPTIRGFLLQNLRRGDQGWHWQCNLDLIESHLDDVAAWPSTGLGTFEGPVLWVKGQLSAYVKPEYRPAMGRYFSRHRRVTVKEAGHWVHSEQPQVFTSLVDQFLSD